MEETSEQGETEEEYTIEKVERTVPINVNSMNDFLII